MTGEHAAAGRRPWHLWVVGIVALLWNCMGALDFIMTATRNEAYLSRLTPEQLAYFYGVPVWVMAAWGLATWGGLAGTILLLFRRKLAMPVYVVSLVAMVLSTIHTYFLSDGGKVMNAGVGTAIFTSAIFLVCVALVVYAHRLTRRGVLA